MLSKSQQILEQKLNYTFNNKSLLIEALTHPSKKLENKNTTSYQRLELLGDKVLNFVIANELFLKFPNEDEGHLSRRHAHLVCGTVCFDIATKIGLLEHVIFSTAQKNDIHCKSAKVSEDAIEAIIGAIFLDSSISCVMKIIIEYWTPYIHRNITPPKDAKSTIQEYFQKDLKVLPEYTISEENNLFTAKLSIRHKIFTGTAQTKKDAEKNCAKAALEFLNGN